MLPIRSPGGRRVKVWGEKQACERAEGFGAHAKGVRSVERHPTLMSRAGEELKGQKVWSCSVG